MVKVNETKKQEIDKSKTKRDGEDYNGYQIPFMNDDALALVQVKSTFEMGVTSTNIEFSNGTIMPMTPTAFQEFTVWFENKRNSFFTYGKLNNDGTLQRANKQQEGMVSLDLFKKDINGDYYSIYLLDMVDGFYVPDATKIQQKAIADLNNHISSLVQNHLDTNANTYGYDSIYTAIGYVGDPCSEFNADGLRFRNWRSAVWVYVNAEAAKLELGQRTIPTDAELIAELPLLSNY